MAGELARFWRRLLNGIRAGRAEPGLEREISTHLALLEDEYRRRGLTPVDAHRAARLAIGGIEQTKEQHRDARAFRWIDNARRDAIYAVRMLRRQPAAAATAALSLAIGIGLNAAVFSIVDWVLLRPLPYRNGHELVRVFSAGTAPVTGPGALKNEEADAFARAASLRETAVFSMTTRVMAGAGVDPFHVVIARVAGDLSATLGVYPAVGRGFSPQEIAAGTPVVLLSHDVWSRQFSGERATAGRLVTIDGAPHIVVGVMPPGRGYPQDADVWRPLTAEEREDNDGDLNMLARLSGGTTAARASVELATLARGLSSGSKTAWAEDLQWTGVRNVSGALEALFAAAALTLLLACANVAALVAARGSDRAGEMVVRGALGATRARVIGQLVTESLVLAIAGGAVGLLVGRWALTALIAMAPVSIPRLAEVSLDGRILAVGLALTLLTGLAVGLAPAIHLSRVSLTPALMRAGSARLTSRPTGRRALVLAQIAVAVVLTTGAGLLIRSLQHVVTIDHGFEPDRLVSIRVFPPRSFDGNVTQLFRDLAAGSEATPGVEAAAWSMRLPTQTSGVRATVAVPGEGQLNGRATWRPISPNYFDVAGIPVTAGRGFVPTDTRQAPRVAIVNATFARDLLGGRSPLGVRLTTSLTDEPLSIVGVAGDVTPAGQADRPAVYVPVEQSPIGEGHLLVRTREDPRSVIPALTNRLRAVAPGLAFDRVARAAAPLEESRAVTRFVTQVTAVFSGLALLLSMIGVYGLTAGDVAARWREIAVRLALGASAGEAVWTVMRPCAVILGAGAAIGIAGALSVGPALGSLLHGVGPTDVATVAGAPLLLVLVGMLAAALASRRVLQADPASTLRSE